MHNTGTLTPIQHTVCGGDGEGGVLAPSALSLVTPLNIDAIWRLACPIFLFH